MKSRNWIVGPGGAFLLVGIGIAKADETALQINLHQCAALINAYAVARDHHNYDGYANLFTKDGELLLPGNAVKGRDAIRASFADRAEGETIRHLMTTRQIQPSDNGGATGISYATIIQNQSETPAEGPIARDNYNAVIEYHDVFEQTVDGCKFAKREIKVIFAGN